jgi:23S rRNA (guanosine2251-2'-O)-methyltransferase
MANEKLIQIESKNALLELLHDNKQILRIHHAMQGFNDAKTAEILRIARERKIPIIEASRKSLNRMAKGGSIESVVGVMVAQNQWKLDELIEKVYSQGLNPFFLLLDHLHYEQNVGAVLRTAFASGVNGIITPLKRDNFLTSESIRISMGAALRIPIVEMNLFSSLAMLKKSSIRIIAVTMDGVEYYKADLKGPVAFVLGAEDTGISTRMLEKSDEHISIPMREGIGSLNVGASAAVVCYEKLRQEVG